MFQGKIGEILFLSPRQSGLFLVLAIFIHPSLPKIGHSHPVKNYFFPKGIEKGYPLKKFHLDKLKIKSCFQLHFFGKVMVSMMTKRKIFDPNFTFYETFKDEPIPHKNFMILGQGSHEIPGGSPDPSLGIRCGYQNPW